MRVVACSLAVITYAIDKKIQAWELMRYFLCGGISLSRILLSPFDCEYRIRIAFIAILLQFARLGRFSVCDGALRRRRNACARHEYICNVQRMFYASCIVIDASQVTASNCEMKLFLHSRYAQILPIFREA